MRSASIDTELDRTKPARAALVIDGDRLFAEALGPVLEDMGFCVSVATTETAAISALDGLSPDLVLVDVSMPNGAGLELGKRALNRGLATVVIGVMAKPHQQRSAECRRAGFSGCVSKDTPVSRFERLIESGLRGRPVRSHSPAAKVGHMPPRTDADLLAFGLTARELEVLSLLVDGASGREIAERCRISPNTVRTHVQSVLTKLQVHSRLEAAALAVRLGFAGRTREYGAA